MMTRRHWLSLAAATAAWRGLAPAASIAAQRSSESELTSRIRRIVREYEEQGFHRTATAVDERSADWLIAEVRRIGLAPAREPFTLDRIDPANGAILADGRRIEGLPLFDGGFTGAD